MSIDPIKFKPADHEAADEFAKHVVTYHIEGAVEYRDLLNAFVSFKQRYDELLRERDIVNDFVAREMKRIRE